MIILLVISKLRPQNLSLVSNQVMKTLERVLTQTEISLLSNEGSDSWTVVIKNLNTLFWLFYHQKPLNPVVSSVKSQGTCIVIDVFLYLFHPDLCEAGTCIMLC